MRKTKQEISQDLISLRRQKVLEDLSTGHTSHREIAQLLHVAHDTIDRDVRYWMQYSKDDIRRHFESLPLEIRKCMIGLELTIKAFTNIIESETTEPVHRLSALTARMQAYRFKMDILDGKAQLDEVFAFIDDQQQEKEKAGRGQTQQKGKEAIDDIPKHT
jgi:hypothetical protein